MSHSVRGVDIFAVFVKSSVGDDTDTCDRVCYGVFQTFI